MLVLINSVLGAALLVAGRKLFWLFVGALGFLLGLQLTTRFFQGSDAVGIIVGLVVGILFALLAIGLQSLAIFVAGFFSGAYVASVLGTMFGLEQDASTWILFLAGGIIGMILVWYLFDWAIVTLSSLAGASLIVEALVSRSDLTALIFTVLFFAGVLIQGASLRAEKQA